MHRQSGLTLVELLILVAIASLTLGVTASHSLPMLAEENVRGAIYDVQTYVQLARIEAISRNRDCSFRVDTTTGTLLVTDSMGTPSSADDRILYERALPDEVAFARPDGATAVSLALCGDGEYETVFSGDGTVASGTGELGLLGGIRYEKLAVLGAGGVRIERWTGSSWSSGT